MFRRPIALMALVAGVASGVALPALAEPGPETKAASEMVRTTTDQILVVLAKGGEDEARIKSIESIVFANFDFTTISRLVLARNYKRFSEDQQVEFERLYKVYLSRSYGKRLLRYEQEKVEVVNARLESRGDVTVMTKIVGGQADDIDMNYRARPKDGAWKVIDVTIEGISLVSNYRSQFKELINKEGPDGLLKRLADKTFVLPEDE
jgi:phospholipid transport system substrate-binding protein